MTEHPEELKIAADEYENARKDIVEYIHGSSDRRALLAAEGTIKQILTVLSAEMALAGSLGQIDTVLRLGLMAENLVHAEATFQVRESEDYRRRFGEEVEESTDNALRR